MLAHDNTLFRNRIVRLHHMYNNYYYHGPCSYNSLKMIFSLPLISHAVTYQSRGESEIWFLIRFELGYSAFHFHGYCYLGSLCVWIEVWIIYWSLKINTSRFTLLMIPTASCITLQYDLAPQLELYIANLATNGNWLQGRLISTRCEKKER